MALELITYKPDQGRLTRLAAFGILGALTYYAAVSLYHFMTWDWAARDLGYQVPLLDVPLSLALIIATGVLIGGLLLLRSAANRPNIAELLIDTEGEMRRVTWPSWPDTLNGSFVVIVTVVAMLLILSGADFLLSRIFEVVIFRQ